MTVRFNYILPKNFPSLLFFVFMVAGGFLIRLKGLHDYAFSPDELFYLDLASADSILGVLKNVMQMATHAPPYHFLLYYFGILNLSEIMMRSVMIFFGLSFVILMFFLAKKYFGLANAYFVAFMAAFGTAPVVLSQVLREYIILLVLEVVIIYFYLNFVKIPTKRTLLIIFLLSALAVSTSYSAGFALAGIFLYLTYLAFRNDSFRIVRSSVIVADAYLFVLVLLIFAIFIAPLYVMNSSTAKVFFDMMVNSGNFAHTSVISTLFNLGENFISLLLYLSFPSIVAVSLLLIFFCCGFFFQAKRRSFSIIIPFVIMLVINIIASIYKLYPFIASRHCIYLLPFILLISGEGAAVLYYRLCRPVFIKFFRQSYLIPIFAMFILLVIVTSFLLVRTNLYRQYRYEEFPIKKADLDSANALIFSNVRSGDKVFVTNDFTFNYLFRNSLISTVMGQKDKDHRIFVEYSKNGVQYNFLDKKVDLNSAFDSMARSMPSGAKIFFYDVGWIGGRDIYGNVQLEQVWKFHSPLSSEFKYALCGYDKTMVRKIFAYGESEGIIVDSFETSKDEPCHGALVFSIKAIDMKLLLARVNLNSE